MGDISPEDFRRIENRIDSLTAAVTQLVRVEERQLNHAELIRQTTAAVEGLKTAQQATDKKLDSWINRGLGIWGLAALAWTVYTGVKP
jgi:two-component sensor histidine kinase